MAPAVWPLCVRLTQVTRTASSCLLLLLLARAGLAQEKTEDRQAGFSFGSYGRAGVASDLRDHSGSSTNIVSHGTRYDAGTYAELELRRDDYPHDLELQTVATIAFAGN